MTSVTLKIFSEINLFDDGVEETKEIPLYSIFDGQTSLDFCLKKGEEKEWYRLFFDSPLKEEELSTTLEISSSGGRVAVSTSSGELIKINDIQRFFEELNDRGKSDPGSYWEILGISKDVRDKKLISKAASTQNRIFSEEKDLGWVFNTAKVGIENALKEYGFASISIDYPAVDVYVDGALSGDHSNTLILSEGEHVIALKSGGREIASKKVNVKGGENKSLSIPVTFQLKGEAVKATSISEFSQQSKITLSLLLLLGAGFGLAFTMENMGFLLMLISFIGVFYKKVLGTLFTLLTGFFAMFELDPLLGYLLIVLGLLETFRLKYPSVWNRMYKEAFFMPEKR